MNTKLIRTPGLYLVGFMGCGKTTVGVLVADELGWNFADLDVDIENKSGCEIAEIFDTLGEPEFRRREQEALLSRVRRVQKGVPLVLSLGGGAFAQPANYEMVKDNGISIWLDCSFDRIQQRIAGETHRPLARDPDRVAELYQRRRESYARADFRVEIQSDDPKVAVEAILALPLF